MQKINITEYEGLTLVDMHLLKNAARLQGKTIENFVLDAAIESAEDIVSADAQKVLNTKSSDGDSSKQMHLFL